MSLTTSDVRKVASLARLAMNETEIETARSQLSGIFELIAEMQAVDTKGIAPMTCRKGCAMIPSPRPISASYSSLSRRRWKPVYTWFRRSSSSRLC
jgi:hypothetical protein